MKSYLDIETMYGLCEELGMDDNTSSKFLTEVLNRSNKDASAEEITDARFLFECIRHLSLENNKLKEQIACMKQGKSYFN